MASCSASGRLVVTNSSSSRLQRSQRVSVGSSKAASLGNSSVFGQASRNSRISKRSVLAKAGDLNPFGKKKEEDAAKKALQEMFSGKEDYLAAYDGPPGGGKSGGGGGGGGDGWFGGFNFNEFGDNFMRKLKSFMSFLGAVTLFGALIYVLSYWKQVFALIGMVLTKIFRLDAGQRNIQNAGMAGNMEASLNDDKSDFGVMEQSIISKYGGDDAEDDAPAAAEGGDEDEEDF